MTDDLTKVLQETKAYINGFKVALVKEIDPAQISVTAKIPFKALQIREALLYRGTELFESALNLIENENYVSGAVLTRAFQETLALTFYVNRKCKKAIQSHDVRQLDVDLMNALVGTKNYDDTPNPISVMKAISAVNKEIDGFEEIYNDLSEISHPNWCGTLGMYTTIDKKLILTKFGINVDHATTMRKQCLYALNAGAFFFLKIYDEFAEFMPELIHLCEKDLEKPLGD